METIKVPSPSAFLDPPTLNTSCAQSAKPASKSSPPSPTKPPAPAQNAAPAAGISKPKQSKSRNGCITCKAKRLKCDETKPTCQQCRRRNVPCGGYKKDFKWRPFEKASFTSKSAAKAKKTATSAPPPLRSRNASTHVLSAPTTDFSISSVRSETDHISVSPLTCESLYVTSENTNFDGQTLADHGQPPVLNDQITLQPQSDGPLELPAQAAEMPDLLVPGVDMEIVGAQGPFGIQQAPIPLQSGGPSFSPVLDDGNDEVEEIVREYDPGTDIWPAQGSVSGQSAVFDSPDAMPNILYRGPDLGPGSEEMLIIRFDRQTCGILSIKDGVTENPWRTSVWPLAKNTPALYHAVFALAAFHASKDLPSLRVYGMEHMRKSITYMLQGIQSMRTDAALATTLSLAFAESWDQHISTGIQHLRGARALVSQAMRDGMQRGFQGEDIARLRFLYNTWMYMDVIARLTSLAETGKEEVENFPLATPDDGVHEIDPLLGCAASLFPLIGQVANLIQRVRKTESNSIAIISEAIELKTLIEKWEPPQYFEPPEDPTSDVQHSFQTAEAYRWATLLYLHQAVPEIPSESAAELAKRVLILLATVPLSSRTTIVQIYPLLAASCEADDEEDRKWILNRWAAMQSRLKIGNIDRCLEVIREVWARRDAFEAEKRQRQRRSVGRSGSYAAPEDATKRESSNGLPMGGDQDPSGYYGLAESWRRVSADKTNMLTSVPRDDSRRAVAASSRQNIEFEKTVRGRLHWIGVMRDWKWEVLLG
ncbi:putative C6 finger domain protein [Thermoascus aurantiacus ATCC 26904]